MTIATLMATCALFLAAGWTAPAYAVLALSIGGVVCIAAANAGATSQDLKTGFLVGATPSYQQMGLFAGVTASAFVIGATLIAMNKGSKYEPVRRHDRAALPGAWWSRTSRSRTRTRATCCSTPSAPARSRRASTC
jgi:uncharacterized oligopeptide transporter (OPT) family protein